MGHYYSEMVSDEDQKKNSDRIKKEDKLIEKLCKKLDITREELKKVIQILKPY